MSKVDPLAESPENPCQQLRESRLWYFPVLTSAVFLLAILLPVSSALESVIFGRGQLAFAIGTALLKSLVLFIIGAIGLFASYVTFATELPMIIECEEIDWEPRQPLYVWLYLLPPLPIFLVMIYTVNYLRKVR